VGVPAKIRMPAAAPAARDAVEDPSLLIEYVI
ncbi:MAG: hypothetical protein K0S43_1694, partial [Cellulosimicrobium sp.]|nr:hypothetical protein [Cellulosimicrobium sp.]